MTFHLIKFRGDMSAVRALENFVYVVADHPEGHAMAVTRIDLNEQEKRASAELPCGATHLAVDDQGAAFVVGTDGHLYLWNSRVDGPAMFRQVECLGEVFDGLTGIALLGKNRLALLTGERIQICDRKGTIQQTLELSEPGYCIASDPTGAWLVVGDEAGGLTVFEAESGDEFKLSDRSEIHQGRITSVCFDLDELRVITAGVDTQLLLTHVRGRLEAEDRGGQSNHTDHVMGIVAGPRGRFYTGGKDQEIKGWPNGLVKTRPASIETKKVVDLCIATVGGEPHLVMAGQDNQIRVYSIDDEGRAVSAEVHRYGGAQHWAPSVISNKSRTEEVLRTVAGWSDTWAVEFLARQSGKLKEPKFKLLATELLASSGNPLAIKSLESLISAAPESVQVAAFNGLKTFLGSTDLWPIGLALKASNSDETDDVGVAAVNALGAVAGQDDQALAQLVGAFDHSVRSVRLAALAVAETALGAESPEASLLGLRSSEADVRRQALIRLYQRDLLGSPQAQGALRIHQEDENEDVRQTAFLISVATRPALAHCLRARDSEFHVKFSELEASGSEDATEVPEQPASGDFEPDDDDLAPLLNAAASSALDTALRGMTGLAWVGDDRVLGILLQLSRDDNANARHQACKAIGALGASSLNAHTRSSVEGRLRLLLSDSETRVRDSAFTTINQFYSDDRREAARAGFRSDHEDIHQRALQLVVDANKGEGAGQADRILLATTLDNRFADVRKEAFKAALNLDVGSGTQPTLEFVLKSIHADVRDRAFTEAKAFFKEPWCRSLMEGLLSDPDKSLRTDVFRYLEDNIETDRPALMEVGLSSNYEDVRLLVARTVASESEPSTSALLVRCANDEAAKVRSAAVDALLAANDEKSVVALMQSKHADVRLRAARARAVCGDGSALETLLAFASAPRPEGPEAGNGSAARWQSDTVEALECLEILGDSAAAQAVAALLSSPNETVMIAAAKALRWVAEPGDGHLERALRHEHAKVQMSGALGLAWAGRTEGQSLISNAPVRDALCAAVAQGEGIGRFLDHTDRKTARHALVTCILKCQFDPDAVQSLMTALSSGNPRSRLLGVRALEAYCVDGKAYAAFMNAHFNERPEGEPDWTLSDETLRHLGWMLHQGTARTRVRVTQFIENLEADTQEDFEKAWGVFTQRYQAETADTPAEIVVDSGGYKAHCDSVISGAYVGLLRHGGHASIRRVALQRLVGLIEGGVAEFNSLKPAIIQALGDGNAAVRQLAFNSLRTLGLSDEDLTDAALWCGQSDVGAQGLAILGSTGEGGTAAITDVMLNRTDGLESEAADLLMKSMEPVSVHQKALGAASESLRNTSVSKLMILARTDDNAQGVIIGALGSRYRHVRYDAASHLASGGDAAAFSVLKERLREPQAVHQKAAIKGMLALRTAETAEALFERFENDPMGKAEVGPLFTALGQLRDVDQVDRLIGHLPRDDFRSHAFKAIRTISGYDQKIEDSHEENPNSVVGWEEGLHPRHDAVLAKLLDWVYQAGENQLIASLVNDRKSGINGAPARWARGPELDAVLAPLVRYPDDSIRWSVVEAIGWRSRKRNGPTELLVSTLGHRDETTRFLAAEGLALGGQDTGIDILLSGAELLSDVRHRERAIYALGELADTRCLDLLLRIVNEEGHLLRDEAAVALGHLGDSKRGDEILKLLMTLAQGAGEVARKAMTGLRHLDRPSAWRLLRKQVTNNNWQVRQRAAECLGYNPVDATRDLLQRTLEEDSDYDVARAAYQSLKRIEPEESLLAEYCLMRCKFYRNVLGWQVAFKPEDPVLNRIRKDGDAKVMFTLMGEVQVDFLKGWLRTTLMEKTPVPLAAAADCLSHTNDAVAVTAIQILGRAAGESGADKHGESIRTATTAIRAEWSELGKDANLGIQWARDRLPGVVERWRWLLWACRNFEQGYDEFLAAAALTGRKHGADTIRSAALLGLVAFDSTDEGTKLLKGLLQSGDAQARGLIAQALGGLSPDDALGLAEKQTDDPDTLPRLVAHLTGDGVLGVLRSASASPHSQGVALPILVGRRDEAGLAEIVQNKDLELSIRLGAVEGLTRIASTTVDPIFLSVTADEGETDDFKMSVWRALRRVKRRRSKFAAQEGGV